MSSLRAQMNSNNMTVWKHHFPPWARLYSYSDVECRSADRILRVGFTAGGLEG